MSMQWRATSLAFLTFNQFVPAYQQSTEACTPPIGVATVYVVASVYVSTYIVQNTTFSVNDHLTVTVNNAPTTLHDILVGTSTLVTTATTITSPVTDV
jgi:hypothetical protein